MSFRVRLILLVTGLLVLAVTATTGVLTWHARQQLLHAAERQGRQVALLLGRSAGLASTLPLEIEALIEDHMKAEALLAAHLLQAAEGKGETPREIAQRFNDVAARSVAEEFWVMEPDGRTYIHNRATMDPAYDPGQNNPSKPTDFLPLLAGDVDVVDHRHQKKGADRRLFKYTGVAALDAARIVQVGVASNLLVDLVEQVGVKRTISQLLQGGSIDAVWIYNRDRAMIATGHGLNKDHQATPSEREVAKLGTVIASGQPVTFQNDASMTVIVPILAPSGDTVGVSVVRLPTDHLNTTLREELALSVGTFVVVVLLGVIMAAVTSRWLSKPVDVVALAARAVEDKTFQPEMLDSVAQRADEFGRLAVTFGSMAREVLGREETLADLVRERTHELADKNQQLEAAQARIAEELRVAQQLQISILPTQMLETETVRVYGTMIPAREVSGDFYDFVRLDQDRIAIIIGDVSGKGVPAAFFMAIARTILRRLALAGGAPSALIERANADLYEVNPLELFVTVFFGIYDTRDGSLVYANAGHNPPCLLRRDRSVSFIERTGGLALGVLEEVSYQQRSLTLELGESVFLYTDGVTEAFNLAGEEFGNTRMVAVLGDRTGSEGSVAQHVLDAVDRFSEDVEQSDDITVLCLDRRLRSVPKSDPVRASLKLSVANQPSALQRLATETDGFVASHALSAKDAFHVGMCLEEVVSNVINHGYDDDQPHSIDICLDLVGGRLDIMVSDDGKPFDPLNDAPPPDLAADIEDRRLGGLGVHLIKTLMEEVRYQRLEGRNVLTMTLRLQQTA